MRSPVAGSGPETRADLQRAVRQLYDAVEPRYSPGRARLRPGVTGAIYPDADAECEGFSRLLWGIVPLAAGGGAFDDWEGIRTGLINGCDPEHEEYWGTAGDNSQKHVEMAAIGTALAMVPERVWGPLDGDERRRIVDWLTQINEATLPDGNWLYFRVLTNLGLRSVGAEHDWEQVQADLGCLEGFALTDGWYSDGTEAYRGPRDHYVAWELQFDGLLYAALAADPDRATRLRERARQFAGEYVHWFDADGRALPYGRSLTYRFAQAAFWGALAFADARPEWLSWGQLRGLWARNVRWWLDQPIFTDGGALSIGYRYPSLRTAEVYNSPSGPYWALKAALPLALPADHPFWAAGERPLPDLPAITVQDEPNVIVCRDEETGHHYALAAGQDVVEGSLSADREKYNKFAYSSSFGFSVATGRTGLAGAGHDSALVLSEDGRHFRMREGVADQSVADGVAFSRWTPFEDVTVETWLVPAPPWHVRIHRLDTGRSLHSAEGGFALDRTADDDPDRHEHRTGDGSALARYPAGVSGIRSIADGREGRVDWQDPNANLHAQRTVVPTLLGQHDPGETWLTAAVVATPDTGVELPWDRPPRVGVHDTGFAVTDADGNPVYEYA